MVTEREARAQCLVLRVDLATEHEARAQCLVLVPYVWLFCLKMLMILLTFFRLLHLGKKEQHVVLTSQSFRVKKHGINIAK